jgi:hypothetical protein
VSSKQHGQVAMHVHVDVVMVAGKLSPCHENTMRESWYENMMHAQHTRVQRPQLTARYHTTLPHARTHTPSLRSYSHCTRHTTSAATHLLHSQSKSPIQVSRW